MSVVTQTPPQPQKPAPAKETEIDGKAAGKPVPTGTPAPAQPAAKPAPAKPAAAPAAAAAKPAAKPDPAAQPPKAATVSPKAKPAPPAAAAAAAAQNLVSPPVTFAKMEKRHVLILASFVVTVLLPTIVAAWYLWAKAADQYVSTVAFSVRKEDASPSIEILGGITQLTGSGGATDTDILYDFLRSEDLVDRVDKAVDLRGKFSKAWPGDPVFAFNPDLPIEDLTRHWRRRVEVIYSNSTRLITMKVSAFTPEDAMEIAKAAFDESSRTINRLSDIGREDATKFARGELARARDRLANARQDITAFRMRTQIVDPAADLAGQMGVLNTLQAQLAESLIAHDTLSENARPDDPRMAQSRLKIDAIRARIEQERSRFGAGGEGPGGENYAQLMAEYEKLAADMEFAETTFRSALASYEASLAEAQRQSRYLAAHIEPKLAETSIKPERWSLLATVFGALLIGWSIMLLVYYSIRDRR